MIAIILWLTLAKRNPIIEWLSSTYLSVALIGGILCMAIVMGVVPQYAKINIEPHIHWGNTSWSEISNYIIAKLGFRQVTSSWTFVLLYGFTLLVLGLVVAKRLRRFRWPDFGFYLNHIGLWLFLFAAGIGAADMLRYVMYVEEGEVEWRVYDQQENVLELDIAIELHKFIMEVYQPKLVVIDKYSGEPQPPKRPQYYQIDTNNPLATLGDWEVEVKEYIHEAVRQTDTTFQHIPMAGSMPAARVRAVNNKTNLSREGWVSCGSFSQYLMPLDLDSTYSLLMTQPEAKRYASDITIIAKDERIEPLRTVVEVNDPIKLGNWMIYQYDYDKSMGKASSVSGFELVYDPWLTTVYVGIILTAVGSICMLWMGNRKRGEKR